jgi:hypothetical protein
MFRLVEFTGRWGMLDVLLVAILVAVLKLGDLVEVSPGPGGGRVYDMRHPESDRHSMLPPACGLRG